MKDHLKRQIELHEKISDGYDKRYSTSYSVLYAIKRNEYLISLFKEHNIRKVLDVGCGTGFTMGVLSRFSNNVFGLDTSLGMLSKVDKTNAVIKGVTVGDAESIPYGNDSFTHVICKGALHHFQNSNNALLEIHRVLKIGGELVTSEPSKDFFLIRLVRYIMYRTNRNFDPSERAYKEKELVTLINSSGFDIRTLKRYGFFAYIFAGFPEIFPIMSFVPFNKKITKLLIKIDEVFALLPFIKKMSLHTIVVAIKNG